MGGGASTSSEPPPRGPTYAASDISLARQRHLASPVVGEFVDNEGIARDRWMVIAFVCPTGALSISASSMDNSERKLYTFQATDDELVDSKAQQGFECSWSNFFRAVAVEVPKMRRGGVLPSWVTNGQLRLDIKLSTRYGDHFVCELDRADSSEKVFDFLLWPLARIPTDYARSAAFAQVEVESVRHIAGIKILEASTIKQQGRVHPLRRELHRLREEAHRLAARVALGRHVLSEGVAVPTASLPLREAPIRAHVDAMLGVVRPLREPSAEDDSVFDSIEADVPRMGATVHTYERRIDAMAACEKNIAAVSRLTSEISSDFGNPTFKGLGYMGFFVALRILDWAVLKPFGVTRRSLRRFFIAMESMYFSTNTSYYSAERACTVLGVVSWCVGMLPRLQTVLVEYPAEAFCLLVAAVSMDANQHDLCNEYHVESDSLLSTMYRRRSPMERHSAALALELLTAEGIVASPAMATFLCNLLIATDECLEPSLANAILHRREDVVDFTRLQSDRVLLLGMVLRFADLSVVGVSPLRELWAKRFSSYKSTVLRAMERLGRPTAATPSFPTFSPVVFEALTAVLPEAREVLRRSHVTS